MTRHSSLVVCSAALILSACSGGLQGDIAHVSGNGMISGKIYAAEGASIPANSRATVELVDLSLENTPDKIFASGLAGEDGAFSFDYNKTAIRPNHTYAVRARIEGDGWAMVSDKTAYVLTYGFPARARVRVVPFVAETPIKN